MPLSPNRARHTQPHIGAGRRRISRSQLCALRTTRLLDDEDADFHSLHWRIILVFSCGHALQDFLDEVGPSEFARW
jgi:hypothetical protein